MTDQSESTFQAKLKAYRKAKKASNKRKRWSHDKPSKVEAPRSKLKEIGRLTIENLLKHGMKHHGHREKDDYMSSVSSLWAEETEILPPWDQPLPDSACDDCDRDP